MHAPRPYCLSIAGFDPSGGAGTLADIKTFEANKVYGMAVVSGITFQNDSEFEGVKWTGIDEIIRQLEILLKKFPYEYIKIGMVEDLTSLEAIISCLTSHISSPKIIWDPIIKTSSGFEIQRNFTAEKIVYICGRIFLITPNIDEIRLLLNMGDEFIAAKQLSEYCNVFLKGGHNEKNPSRDFLFLSSRIKENRLGIYPFRAKKISDGSKHGSGCVISSAITANLAKGESLHRACLKAKNYVTDFFFSNKTLLGYHKI